MPVVKKKNEAGIVRIINYRIECDRFIFLFAKLSLCLEYIYEQGTHYVDIDYVLM
jgi:hypothetical protein